MQKPGDVTIEKAAGFGTASCSDSCSKLQIVRFFGHIGGFWDCWRNLFQTAESRFDRSFIVASVEIADTWKSHAFSLWYLFINGEYCCGWHLFIRASWRNLCMFWSITCTKVEYVFSVWFHSRVTDSYRHDGAMHWRECRLWRGMRSLQGVWQGLVHFWVLVVLTSNIANGRRIEPSPQSPWKRQGTAILGQRESYLIVYLADQLLAPKCREGAISDSGPIIHFPATSRAHFPSRFLLHWQARSRLPGSSCPQQKSVLFFNCDLLIVR